ncbi:hypothetical protein BKA64DRAFT_765472 [Cadophora sp. MPI-SDFR-AT-0126]|nr:hypothetical protein BKA64DRAFT_765472 [Leotiomycetes sp. MPI-SDFR-AT-0126]
MTSVPEPVPQPPGPSTLDFHLQNALKETSSTSDPVSLYTLPSSSPPAPIPLNPLGPTASSSTRAPSTPHTSATSPPSSTSTNTDMISGLRVCSSLLIRRRCKLFATHPLLAPLLQTGFLKILTGSMTSHIALLRHTTDLITAHHIPATLTGFLGGDKLSVNSSPHQKPGELIEWGPLDEFLIMNARRPVDFYCTWESEAAKKKSQNPEYQHVEQIDIDFPPVNRPDNLPGCTTWERGPIERESIVRESRIGQLWSCRALTVPGEPVIRFRASDGSKSDGISSTGVRRIMCEVEDGELLGRLRGLVLCPEALVEWLVKERERKGAEGQSVEGEEKAFL